MELGRVSFQPLCQALVEAWQVGTPAGELACRTESRAWEGWRGAWKRGSVTVGGGAGGECGVIDWDSKMRDS